MPSHSLDATAAPAPHARLVSVGAHACAHALLGAPFVAACVAACVAAFVAGCARPQRTVSAARPVPAAPSDTVFPAGTPRQTDADHYTRYELLAPGSAKFRIIYEVTATAAGATRYFNPIRKGSVASDEAVFDRMTGKPLEFGVVAGSVARAGGVAGADTTGQYIMVRLARPVPAGGEARILIDKTYEDARSYYQRGDTIVFERSLGIKRNSVVLPQGFHVVAVNYPSQIRSEPDGRIQLSFMNPGPADVPYVVKARRPRKAQRIGGGDAR